MELFEKFEGTNFVIEISSGRSKRFIRRSNERSNNSN